MVPDISIIIPNFNGSRTIGLCLDALHALKDESVEVVVVDDCSTDGSVDIIRKYPCKLVALGRRSGAAAARNAGAANSTGSALFFIDADCVIRKDTLPMVRQSLAGQPHGAVIGGTYEPVPYDPGFFNHFQSVFINYSETRNCANPDYIATHALVIRADVFRTSGGFAEKFLPILEDVEFSHRLRKAGCRLIMNPLLRVRHIFHFSLAPSLRNAVKKARYWIEYSLSNKDVFSDSGTASRGLKICGFVWLLSVLLGASAFILGRGELIALLPVFWTAGIASNAGLIRAFHASGGRLFAVSASAYYVLVYPAAVWTGTAMGIMQYLFRRRSRKEHVLTL